MGDTYQHKTAPFEDTLSANFTGQLFINDGAEHSGHIINSHNAMRA